MDEQESPDLPAAQNLISALVHCFLPPDLVAEYPLAAGWQIQLPLGSVLLPELAIHLQTRQ
jgi:hypothetical protein